MDLIGIQEDLPDIPDAFTPDMADWWTGPGATLDAATGFVTDLKAAGANDGLVAVMVWFIGVSMLIGVLRRSINQVVLTGTHMVDREHSLSVEKRKKAAGVGPYYIPPTPGQLGIGSEDDPPP